jgi:hypothetical protein
MEMAANIARRDLPRRIDAIGWGLLFLMTGTLALIPGLPEGTWLAGLRVLLLGLNAARIVLGLSPEWLTVILGSVALLGGLGGMVGAAVPEFVLLLILCGVAMIAGQLVRGRAER